MWLFDLLFSSILQIWYVEVRISRSISEITLDFEITRVDCIAFLYPLNISACMCVCICALFEGMFLILWWCNQHVSTFVSKLYMVFDCYPGWSGAQQVERVWRVCQQSTNDSDVVPSRTMRKEVFLANKYSKDPGQPANPLYLIRAFGIDRHILQYPLIFQAYSEGLNPRMPRKSIFPITKTHRFKYIENFITENWMFSDKISEIFHISAQNIRLWALVRTASPRQF